MKKFKITLTKKKNKEQIASKSLGFDLSGEQEMVAVIVKNAKCAFNAEMIKSIDLALVKQNKVLVLIQSSFDNLYLLEKINVLLSLGIKGVILADGTQYALKLKKILDKHQIPLVVVAKSSDIHNINIVKANNWLGAKQATELLISRGHRYFAYIGGESNSLTRAERLGGFGDTISRFGLKFRSEWIIDNSDLAELNSLEMLLKQYPRLSAFLCHDSNSAIALFLCAFKTGRNIYKTGLQTYLQSQIEVICFDNSAEIKILNHAINCVDSQPAEIGRQAVNCLLNMQDSSPQEIVIPPRLVS